MRAGETKVLCSVNTVTAGFDMPQMGCIIDARPTKSEIRFVQGWGRGGRTFTGKRDCIVLDHAGNALRLGLPPSIQPRKQPNKAGDRGKPERSAPLPKKCDHCHAINPRDATICENCREPFFTRTRVRHIDGELVELGSRTAARSGSLLEVQKTFYGEMLWQARARGYKDGWIAHQYKKRFGVWPNDYRVKQAEPRQPSIQTRNWIISQAIAYKKDMAGHG